MKLIKGRRLIITAVCLSVMLVSATTASALSINSTIHNSDAKATVSGTQVTKITSANQKITYESTFDLTEPANTYAQFRALYLSDVGTASGGMGIDGWHAGGGIVELTLAGHVDITKLAVDKAKITDKAAVMDAILAANPTNKDLINLFEVVSATYNDATGDWEIKIAPRTVTANGERGVAAANIDNLWQPTGAALANPPEDLIIRLPEGTVSVKNGVTSGTAKMTMGLKSGKFDIVPMVPGVTKEDLQLNPALTPLPVALQSHDTTAEVAISIATAPIVQQAAVKACMLRSTAAGSTTIKFKWDPVAGATGYKIYGTKCGHAFKYMKTVTGRTNTTQTMKGLKKGEAYKYYVKAYKKVNGQVKYLYKTNEIHVATTANKFTNAKTLKTNFTAATLKKGATKQFKGSITLVNKNKKVLNHVAKVRFLSSNKKIATVTSGGVIKGKAKGACYVYAYASNGIYKAAKITVK